MRRLYLTNSAAPSFDPSTTVIGTWDDTSNANNSGGLLTVPSGSTGTDFFSETSTDTAYDVILAHWTSAPMAVSTILGGTVRWVIATSQSSAAADMVTHCHIWVTEGSTTNVRGVLLDNFIGSTEWTVTTVTGMTDGVQTLTELHVKAGDHVCVEFGFRATNNSSTPYVGTMNWGTTGTPDLEVGDTGAALRPSWIEFSQDFWNTQGFRNRGTRPRGFAPGLAR